MAADAGTSTPSCAFPIDAKASNRSPSPTSPDLSSAKKLLPGTEASAGARQTVRVSQWGVAGVALMRVKSKVLGSVSPKEPSGKLTRTSLFLPPARADNCAEASFSFHGGFKPSRADKRRCDK